MKRKQGIIAIFLVIGTIYPQVALAAWWNPLSWFKEQDVEQEKAQLQSG